MLAELAMIAASCAPDIHLTTLKAVVKHESGFNQFAIGVNKGKKLDRQPSSHSEAVEVARSLIADGVDFDAGLGQINVRNWGWLGLTAETVFDPCTNLKAHQAVLKDCYARALKQFSEGQPALTAALSCYNTGNFRNGFSNGYVRKVIAAAGIKVPGIDSASVKELRHSQQAQAPKSVASHGSEVHQRSSTDAFTVPRPDAFAAPRPDAFAAPRPDAFSRPRGDAFGHTYIPPAGVGAIRYLRPTHQ